MAKLNGIHHLALCTSNMKEQIEFFSDVLGMELVALYWMHGAEGCWHGFLKLNDSCSFAFVFTPDTPNIERVEGVTHSRFNSGISAPGTAQHIAFNVETMEDLLNLRDRIRSRGVNVIGPIEEGPNKSLYFAGPEELTMEVSVTEKAINPEIWIDPAVASSMGISADELARYKAPAPYVNPGKKVKNPKKDYDKPHIEYLPPLGELICKIPDGFMYNVLSYPKAPNEPKKKKWWNIFGGSEN